VFVEQINDLSQQFVRRVWIAMHIHGRPAIEQQRTAD
jgi:hypothetical protein